MPIYEAISKYGDRKDNQDYVGVVNINEKHCFILADGLGGHEGGANASKLAVQSVERVFFQQQEVTRQCMEQCFEESQRAILKEQKSKHIKNGMLTTLVILMTDKNYALWGHVGDSRLYVFNNHHCINRTIDHSVPQMLAAAGEIKEKQIRNHKDRNKLLSVIGEEWDTPGYEIAKRIDLDKGMSFLLCSDGFWELIEEKQMETMGKRSITCKDWLERMEKKVLRKGRKRSMDNFSAICVWMKG
jgi:serine/threonine protein phosphatase PrpC